jgi:membrane dipeptidase
MRNHDKSRNVAGNHATKEREAKMAPGDGTIALEASALYRDALVWDMVVPIHAEVGNSFALSERFRAAGFSYISFTIAGDDTNLSEATKRLAVARAQILAAPDRFVLVETCADILAAKRQGKLAIGLHFEGTRAFERREDMIEVFYKLGIRQTNLAFNKTNSVGGGCIEPVDPGLTRFGVKFVEELRRVGMLIDLSHTGRRTGLQVMDSSSIPTIFSHSNPVAVHDHYRNLTDEQIRACAATGGVIGISGSSGYLGDPLASNETIFRCIDYVAQLVGPDHVGLGLDYCDSPDLVMRFIAERPEEWTPVSGKKWDPLRFAPPEQVPSLVEHMLRRGYREAQVRGVLGLNFLRVMQAVWK